MWGFLEGGCDADIVFRSVGEPSSYAELCSSCTAVGLVLFSRLSTEVSHTGTGVEMMQLLMFRSAVLSE